MERLGGADMKRDAMAELSTEPERGQGWRLVALALITVLVIGIAVYYVDHRDIPFDRDAWIQGDPDAADPVVETHRAAMLKDLLSHHPLEGMNRQGVIALLGAPAHRTDTAPNELWYPVSIRWDGIDPSDIVNLVVELDAHDVVRNHRVVEYHRH
jgi:hypothetical protein